MMTAEQRADFYRRRARSAHDRAIAARLAEITLEQARRHLDAITPDPEWLTAARRNQLDMDARAFAQKRGAMRGTA